MSKKRTLFTFLAFIIIFNLTVTPPFAAGSQADDLLYPQKIVLDNKMTVILQEDHSHPLVSVNLFVKTSELNETEQISGISHFYEHLFFRGTEKRSGADFKQAIESLGGVSNAETNKDFTHYYINLPSAYTKEAINLLGEALMLANFMPNDLEKERKVILEEYNIYKETPMTQLINDLYKLAYSDHPYGRTAIGTDETIKNISRADILEYKKKYYAPENVSLVIVGDFDSFEILEFIQNNFKNFKPNEETAASPNSLEAPEPASQPKIVTKMKKNSETFMAFGYLTTSVKDKSRIYSTDVLIFLLGKGEGSLLIKNVKKDKELVNEIDVTFLTSKEPGLLIITASLDPGNLEMAKVSILNQLDSIKQGNFTDNDLDRTKTLLINTYLFDNETNSGKANALGFYESIDSCNFAIDYINKIKNVTKEDIIKEANRIFQDNFYLVVYKPS